MLPMILTLITLALLGMGQASPSNIVNLARDDVRLTNPFHPSSTLIPPNTNDPPLTKPSTAKPEPNTHHLPAAELPLGTQGLHAEEH